MSETCDQRGRQAVLLQQTFDQLHLKQCVCLQDGYLLSNFLSVTANHVQAMKHHWRHVIFHTAKNLKWAVKIKPIRSIYQSLYKSHYSIDPGWSGRIQSDQGVDLRGLVSPAWLLNRQVVVEELKVRLTTVWQKNYREKKSKISHLGYWLEMMVLNGKKSVDQGQMADQMTSQLHTPIWLNSVHVKWGG